MDDCIAALRYARNMDSSELVTVFRSADMDAGDDADTVRALLESAGLNPVLLDDNAPGVVEGSYEVRVPAGVAKQAEELIAANAQKVEEHVDPSHELDLVSIFHSEAATTAEVEALAIKSILEASGISAVIVGNSTLPNLPFEVKVPRESEQEARNVLAEARAGGAAAAEEAERASEESTT
jgi:hypothetical protein